MDCQIFANDKNTHENVKDLVDVFPSDLDAVNLQDFVSLRQQSAPFGRSASNNATDHHAFHLITNSRPLQDTQGHDCITVGFTLDYVQYKDPRRIANTLFKKTILYRHIH